ncbi:cupin domain-containing protein [Paradevosia shaoguanensis]
MGMSENFSLPKGVVWVDSGGGVMRAVLSERPELMMVAFAFPEGGVGALHSHPHVQSSFVAEGRFEVTIEGETMTVPKGGSFIVPPSALHGVKALEKGLLIDAFTPRRDDFL